MTAKYYCKNIFWGLFFLAGFAWAWSQDMQDRVSQYFFVLSLLSCPLYPFAKKGVETLALRFTTRAFWQRGYFTETPGKNGLYALYYGACFLFAIPLGLGYLLYLLLNKKAG
ncbi:colicin E1 family microcin immunity protein [Kosakonia sp.]|uniref:colicin E1 family microcin immunity protein n=1 Tax=Kosakonia sp. TaxID=1916651 RepID=UPI00289B0583|nr:colicin E1 family microcin immunity protein [Kosakonia sp.]